MSSPEAKAPVNTPPARSSASQSWLRHDGEDLVVITHGGVLSALLRHTLNIPLETHRRFGRANATWNLFSCLQGTWFLETWNDVSHLSEAPRLEGRPGARSVPDRSG